MPTDQDNNIDRYRNAVLACHLAMNILEAHDLPQIISDISRADSIGAMLDPTLYREKQLAMHEDQSVVEAALPLWRLKQKIVRGRR